MIVWRDRQRYELTVETFADVWVAKIFGFAPEHFLPTHYLLQQYDSREAAIAAIRRRWHILFPDEPPLVWREPV